MKGSRIKFVWYFLKPYPIYIIGITLFSLSSSFFDGLNVLIIFSILNSIVGGEGATKIGGWTTMNIDFFLKYIQLKDPFIAACLLLIVSVIFRNAFGYLQKILSAHAGYKIWKQVQEKIFKKYITADYQYLLDHRQGEMTYRIYSAPCAIGAMLNYIPQALTEATRIFVISAVLVKISPYIAVVLTSLGIAYYCFTRHIATNISYHLGRGRILASERQNILINEVLTGIRQIKVFNSEEHWLQAFFKAMKEYFRLAFKDSLLLPIPSHLLEVVTIPALALLLIAVRQLYPNNFASVLPILGVFAYAFQRLMPSLSVLGNLRIQIMGIFPIVEILHSTLNEKMQAIGDGNLEILSFENAIRFENVDFSYPNRGKVLKNINISFKKNRTTAVVGPSGAGKSTIADLMVRLFVPDAGRILIDDVNLEECRISSWISKIGFVTQDTFIFNASVADNISFGLRKNREEIVRATREAGAHDFIMEFPNGYDTVVGDRGMKLSGGQRQRIAIARALIRKPEILILDEATSSLDNLSEGQVQEAINKISKKYTVIIIAHRLNTIINADKIIVIDKGEVIEQGKHDELMAQKGFYWSLYNEEGGGLPKLIP